MWLWPGRRGWRWLLLGASLVGAVISYELTWLHLSGGAGAAGLISRLCGPGGAGDCRAVLASRWSRIGGLPVGAWGMAYFTALAVWYLAVGYCQGGGRWWQLYPLALTGVGFAVSLQLVWIMLARLGLWCPLCLICHVINAVLMVGAVCLWQRRAAASRPFEPGASRPPWKLAVVTIVLGLSAAVSELRGVQLSIVAGRAKQLSQAYVQLVSDEDYIVWQWQRCELVEIPVRPDEPIRGRPDAPHRVVVFSDFQCPQCSRLARLLRAVLERFADRVAVVFKHLPMDRSCNERIVPQQSIHAVACMAARAAEAAMLEGGQEAFWRLHDVMMDNQELVARREFGRLARMAGLDSQRLAARMNSPQVASAVARDIADAASLTLGPGAGRVGTVGTPLVILDDRWLKHWAILRFAAGRAQIDLPRSLNLWQRLLSEPTTRPPATSAQ
ncbi:MAG: vitamin K epoxide reductase family protein [Phycisphaerae bacterium]